MRPLPRPLPKPRDWAYLEELFSRPGRFSQNPARPAYIEE